MPLTLGSNIASLSAQRHLASSSEVLNKTFERLSSGVRINRASDDAAGLAIASALNANTRIYSQALRNGNDGLSLLNVVEGAMKELTGILTRMKELTLQSMNGTFSQMQRSALNSELGAIRNEYNRIIASTKFNGVAPLAINGDIESTTLQLGPSRDDLLSFSIGADIAGNMVGDGTFQGALSMGTSAAGVRSKRRTSTKMVGQIFSQQWEPPSTYFSRTAMGPLAARLTQSAGLIAQWQTKSQISTVTGIWTTYKRATSA